MVPVDHEGMHVAHAGVMVGMAVRLGSLPALVLVLMMLVVDVEVAMLHLFVLVHQRHRIGLRPKPRADDRRYHGHGGKHGAGRREAERAAQPPGQRIGEQPAGVGIRALVRRDQERNEKLEALSDAVREGLESGVGDRTVGEIWAEAEARHKG